MSLCHSGTPSISVGFRLFQTPRVVENSLHDSSLRQGHRRKCLAVWNNRFSSVDHSFHLYTQQSAWQMEDPADLGPHINAANFHATPLAIVGLNSKRGSPLGVLCVYRAPCPGQFQHWHNHKAAGIYTCTVGIATEHNVYVKAQHPVCELRLCKPAIPGCLY